MTRSICTVILLGGLLWMAGLSGCVANVTTPLAWVSNTRLDVKDLKLEDRVITGQSKSWAILLGLVVWGDSGLDAALKDAKAKAGIPVAEVYDVKTDRKFFNVLGLYMAQTTIVTAKVAHNE